MIRLDEDITPFTHALNFTDRVRAHLASFSVRSIPVAARVVLAVLISNADIDGKVYDMSVLDITEQAERYSKRTVQRTLRSLEAQFWISTIQMKVRGDWNEKNVYHLLSGGIAWTDQRSLGLSSAGWADYRSGKPLGLKPRGGDKRTARSDSPDLSRCAGPVALPSPPSVLGDGVASRPADPEGCEGGEASALGALPPTIEPEAAPPVTGPAQPEIHERSAPTVHDDLDVIGPRTAFALPDPIPVLHHRIRETLVAAEASDIIGGGYEARIARRLAHHTEEQILQKIRIAGQLRKEDIFAAGTRPCVWTSGNVDAMRGAFWNKLTRAKLPQIHVAPVPAKIIPGVKDATGYYPEERKHLTQQFTDPAAEDRARARAQGSGSTSRVDASEPHAQVSRMSTAAATSRVLAALAASYHEERPLADHASETTARMIVDRHTADGPNGGRLTTDDVVAVIVQYATFTAFKAKRKEMVPPPATLLRFLLTEIRNAQPGCAKTINAKLADTKFIPARGQRQAINRQPGDSLKHLDRPAPPIDPVKLREALALAKKPLVFGPPPAPVLSEAEKKRLQDALAQRQKGTP